MFQRIRKCHYYLEYVVSWFNICNVHPLAVNIMSVCIPAAHCDPLFTKVCTLESLLNSLKKSQQYKEHIIKLMKSLHYYKKEQKT